MTAFTLNSRRPLYKGLLSVATQNCFCAPSKPQRDIRAKKFIDEVIPLWRAQGIDLIGMQEVFSHAEAIPQSSGYPHHWLETRTRHFWQRTHSGLAIMSKHPIPIANREFKSFDARRAWVRFSNTGLQAAQILYPGLPYTVINTHLQSSFHPGLPTQNFDVRMRQIRENLEPLLAPSPNPDSLVVLMGDLNHHTHDPLTREMTPEYKYLIGNLRLADVTTALAQHTNMAAEALFTFGPEILFAEKDYAAAGYKLLFDRIHLGTRNPRHRVFVYLNESRMEIEDTGYSDHKALKMWLSIAVFDLGAEAALDQGARVLFVNDSNPDAINIDMRRIAA